MENNFLKLRSNNIYLSDNDIKILDKYNINYLNYSSINELIFVIEDILNNNYIEDSDLDELSIKLSEYNYYFNTNK